MLFGQNPKTEGTCPIFPFRPPPLSHRDPPDPPTSAPLNSPSGQSRSLLPIHQPATTKSSSLPRQAQRRGAPRVHEPTTSNRSLHRHLLYSRGPSVLSSRSTSPSSSRRRVRPPGSSSAALVVGLLLCFQRRPRAKFCRCLVQSACSPDLAVMPSPRSPPRRLRRLYLVGVPTPRLMPTSASSASTCSSPEPLARVVDPSPCCLGLSSRSAPRPSRGLPAPPPTGPCGLVSTQIQCPLLYTFGPARFGPCTFFFRSANLSIYPVFKDLMKNP